MVCSHAQSKQRCECPCPEAPSLGSEVATLPTPVRTIHVVGALVLRSDHASTTGAHRCRHRGKLNVLKATCAKTKSRWQQWGRMAECLSMEWRPIDLAKATVMLCWPWSPPRAIVVHGSLSDPGVGGPSWLGRRTSVWRACRVRFVPRWPSQSDIDAPHRRRWERPGPRIPRRQR